MHEIDLDARISLNKLGRVHNHRLSCNSKCWNGDDLGTRLLGFNDLNHVDHPVSSVFDFPVEFTYAFNKDEDVIDILSSVMELVYRCKSDF